MKAVKRLHQFFREDEEREKEKEKKKKEKSSRDKDFLTYQKRGGKAKVLEKDPFPPKEKCKQDT